ncbi:MAG: hypothetical protein KDA42_07420 [Planctomycetales bacterium]|nr:hypothetical protein [Planctomycetales bacterium]
MARKPKDEVKASFFSFLDILSGVIGVMSLIIVGMVVISIQTQAQILKTRGGAEMKKLPHYIECSETGIIMQPEAYRIPFDKIKSDLAVQNRLDYLTRHTEDAYLLFLVHRDGGRSYDLVKKMAEEHNLTVGKEPIPLGTEIIFTTSEGDVIEGTGMAADYRQKEEVQDDKANKEEDIIQTLPDTT